jgi:hypothetical protein
MIKIRLLRAGAIGTMRSSIKDNLELYRSGSFPFLLGDPAYTINSDIQFDEKSVLKLKAPAEGNLFEVENCIAVFKAFPNLTAAGAADSRLWIFLSHTYCLDHARERWTIPASDKDAVDFINLHYFDKGGRRGLERNNAVSRLWWMAHLCARVPKMPLDESLRYLLHKSDVRSQIVERPTTSQSIAIFSAVIGLLGKSFKKDKSLFERKAFRRLMAKLNGLGGYRLLDVLDQSTIEGILSSFAKTNSA